MLAVPAVPVVDGLVSATVATGVVSRGTVTAAAGSVSATVATTEVTRGMGVDVQLRG